MLVVMDRYRRRKVTQCTRMHETFSNRVMSWLAQVAQYAREGERFSPFLWTQEIHGRV
jgi:hypothetical protein